MFIKQDANLIVDVIKDFLPQEIAQDPDIIIAGGFALNAFLVNQILTGYKGLAFEILKVEPGNPPVCCATVVPSKK